MSMLGIGVVLALALLAAIAVIAYRSIAAFEASAGRVAHTYNVIAQLNELESAHRRLRLGWRRYLTSGAADLLEDYRLAVADVRTNLEEMQQLTSDNPLQRARSNEVREVLERDIAATDASTAQRQAGKVLDSTATLAVLEAVRPSADRLLQLTTRMQDDERTLLAQREEQTAYQGASARVWIAAGSVLALLVLGFAFWLLRREMAITAAAQRIAQLRASEIEDLYNQAPCGYHSVDANGMLIRINDTELAMLGYRRDELIGKMRVRDIMVAESKPTYDLRVAEFRRDGFLRGAEFTCCRKDGSTFVGRFDGTAVRGPDGEIVERRATVVDITEQKVAAVKLQALNAQLSEYSARLEGMNKELESFSYSVSHDLRAPLRAIDGFSLMLEEDYSDRLDDEGRRLLAVVRRNAGAMGQLIDDLLAFSRLSRAPLATVQVDTMALVREVLAEMGDVKAQVTIAPLASVAGDRALFKQLWINLIGNAVKYSALRDAPLITIDCREEGDAILYRIEDNGAGFDMAHYGKLFGVFQRLHTQSEFPGTGVGLAIVDRIVSRHGGRIWAEGRPGEGATFFFSLPKGTTSHE
jgi:PAS domain S-box-containing protein